MRNPLPVSVHILTYNSADTLETALNSVQDCAEILVVDGGSTDATLTIAKQAGASIIAQPQTGPIHNFANVRNHALRHANQPWIFALDSDEEATPALMDAIREAATKEPAAYNVTRKYVLPDGRVVEHATTYPNKRLYFFHKDAVKRWIKPVHERPELQAGTPVKDLAGACLAPIGTPAAFRQKNLRYLQLEKERSRGKGWRHWLQHRLWHTIRSRAIQMLRLARIWLLPRSGTRLPLRHEWLRLWYGWKLIVATCPLRNR